MKPLIICAYVMMALFDAINTVELRALVYSFLLTRRNAKGAKKIHVAKTRKARITLSYIKEYALYPKQFHFLHRCWMVHLFSVLPQYVSVILVHVFFPDVVLYYMVVLLTMRGILAVIIHAHLTSKRISVFDRRHLHRKRKR